MVNVDQRDSQAASLIASFTYGFTDHFATIAQVQAGLNEDAADFVVSLRFPYTFLVKPFLATLWAQNNCCMRPVTISMKLDHL